MGCDCKKEGINVAWVAVAIFLMELEARFKVVQSFDIVKSLIHLKTGEASGINDKFTMATEDQVSLQKYLEKLEHINPKFSLHPKNA